MTVPDPVAVAVEAALTPSLAEAATEVDAWTKAMAARTVNGWDFTSVGPGPDFPRLRLRSLRVLVEHAQRDEPDPAAAYGGDLTAPLCCCKAGSMCAACGTGRHWDCSDRDDWADDAPLAGDDEESADD